MAHLTIAYMSQAALLLELCAGVTFGVIMMMMMMVMMMMMMKMTKTMMMMKTAHHLSKDGVEAAIKRPREGGR